MATKTFSRREAAPSLEKLQSEIVRLRSFMIGLAGKDAEGEYRPEFIEKILSAASEQAIGQFSDARSFLKTVKQRFATT